jgi:ubiquinone/menaquinone biosynthesis C-methylase UbiE
MSTPLQWLSTRRPYQLIVRTTVLPWVLQGARLEGRLLEIGAGSGAMTAQLLAAQPGLRAVATDFDPQMVAAARKNLAGFGDRAETRQADATALPFPDGQFDIVLSCGMLHHIGDWRAALSEVARVLRPGGRLIGYDITASPAVRRLRVATATMIRPGELEHELSRLPLLNVATRRSFSGSLTRFMATKVTRTARQTAPIPGRG